MSTNFPSQILDAITAAFAESGHLFEKTYYDLRYDLEFQNGSTVEDNPAAEEVTLLDLLQASTAKIKAGLEDPTQTHIHQLIESAFIEQEALKAIETLWPDTNVSSFMPVHFPLLQAAVREHLSEHGLKALDELLEHARQHSCATFTTPPEPLPDQLPDYRLSSFLQWGNDIHLKGDPETPEKFARALAYLETITDYFLEFGLWSHTPADLAYELAYHNEAHRTEVEQSQLSGKPAEYQELTLADLRALSQRRLLGMDETGWNLTHYYRQLNFIDNLIEKAIAAETELHRQSATQSLTNLGKEAETASTQRSIAECV